MMSLTPSLARVSPGLAGPIGRCADRLASLSGWRRQGVAVLLGACAALALPPVGFLPILLICIPGLIWVADGAANRWQTFTAGWWWGLGFYTAGFYWIAHALLIDPWRFGWMIPFATLGLGGVVAVFLGGSTWIAGLIARRGAARLLALAGTWGIGEWVRSWALTGFPWNPLGSVWDAALPVLQLGSLIGAFGLTVFTVLAFGLPGIALAEFGSWRKRAILAVGAAAIVAIAWGAGTIRLWLPEKFVPHITLRLVQADVPQEGKWRDDLRLSHLLEHIELSRGPGFDRVTHVIWPETAAPFFLDQDDSHRILAAQAVPSGGLLLTGAPRLSSPEIQPIQIWNSLVAIDAAAQVTGIYDKVHLVPFGEYVPLRSVLPLAKITAGGMDFTPGDGLKTMDLPGLPSVSPLICYEVIFPGEVVGREQARPGWLLTVTNDGWFGRSAGPYQHLAAARLRAIEEGLPLVRAANTGISAVYDGLGREIGSLALGEKGILDAPLPVALEPTLFSRWGNAISLILAAFIIFLAIIAGKIRL